MKNDRKTFFIECNSYVNVKRYYGGPNQGDLIKYIKTSNVSAQEIKDITLDYLLNIHKGLNIKKSINDAQKHITWIRP